MEKKIFISYRALTKRNIAWGTSLAGVGEDWALDARPWAGRICPTAEIPHDQIIHRKSFQEHIAMHMNTSTGTRSFRVKKIASRDDSNLFDKAVLDRAANCEVGIYIKWNE